MCISINTFLSHNLRTIFNVTKASRCLIYQFNSDYSGYVLVDTKLPKVDITLPYAAAFSSGSRVKIYKPNEFFIEDSYLKQHRFIYYKGPQSVSICTNVSSVEFSPCFLELLDFLGARAYINVPIFKGEKLWGLLSVYQNEPRSWETHIMEYVIQMGYIISTFINYQTALELANKDTLTGLANRHRAETYLLKRVQEGKPYSLIFLDYDEFKLVNDNWGHHIGDQVLIYVSSIINKFIRSEDLAARIGGDEFLIITEEERSYSIANNIRNYLANTPFNEAITCSLSIGILNNTGNPTSDYIQVDKLMYKAKAKGKGLIATDDPVDDKQLSPSNNLYYI